MKIGFVPCYDRWAASSRLRVYTIAEALMRTGLAEVAIGKASEVKQSDVVILQKVAGEVFAVISGHPRVIYDYDDILNESIYSDAAGVSKVFTSDTERHAAHCGRRCEIFPDPIDYVAERPYPAAEPRALAWFGNYQNIQGCLALFESAHNLCALRTISQKPVSSAAEHVQWDYERFSQDLRNCGTAFLSHRGSDPGKSANKMVAAITLGVPCIVNESPAYEALARACGLDWTIVSNSSELAAALRRLQDRDERLRYLEMAQPYVWEHFHPDIVAARVMEIAQGLS